MLHPLLREEFIFLNLDALTGDAALAEMMAKLSSGFLPRQKSQILDLLLQRERFGTTALGNGVAIPRCNFADTAEPVVCLGISRRGISYDSSSPNPVYFLLLMIFPETGFDGKAQFLLVKEAENFLQDAFLRERLKISESSEEAYEIVVRESVPFSGQWPMAGNL